MLIRCVQLQDHELIPNDLDIDALLLNVTAERKVHVLIKKMEDLEEVKKESYNDWMQVSAVRPLTLILCYRLTWLINRTESWCSECTDPHFESKLLRVQEFQKETLPFLVKKELICLLLNKEYNDKITTKESSIIKQAARWLTRSGEWQKSSYLDTSFRSSHV